MDLGGYPGAPGHKRAEFGNRDRLTARKEVCMSGLLLIILILLVLAALGGGILVHNLLWLLLVVALVVLIFGLLTGREAV